MKAIITIVLNVIGITGVVFFTLSIQNLFIFGFGGFSIPKTLFAFVVSMLCFSLVEAISDNEE